ncbi:UNVERIFIED_CONTAM: hypothetical protein HDU68_000680 [Siphonaria sp. JEL0065]|nr:hypothetical protein HDU68_002592 [Siphonaria sp. JEL0065]KAJ3028878.1 hypothetical protein HDU68_000680 [Siphonaria sp. JEL0065]
MSPEESVHVAKKLKTTSNTVCVLGVGYVGEHLVSTFQESFPVIGCDISPERINLLKKLHADYKSTTFTTDVSEISKAGLILISVPTLVNIETSQVDLSYVRAAVQSVTTHAKAGSTVVLESTVGVGHTRELLAPLRDMGIFVGFSPERVDPGRVDPPNHKIPKVISGIDAASLASVRQFYSEVFETVIPVKSMETAEMVKLYENCFRMINITYINEISDACESKGVDVWEVVQAASSKPFGFMPFYPSLGVGGHCIPVNPHYMFASGLHLPLLRIATEHSANRPKNFATKLVNELHEQGISNARILVVGIAFKPGQDVISHSPACDFAKALQKEHGADVIGFDPLVRQKSVPWLPLMDAADWNAEKLESDFDCIAVAMKQVDVDYSLLDKISTKVVYFTRI